MRPLTKREAAAATVAAIRAKYPNPVVGPLTSDGYCVLIAASRCGQLIGVSGKGRFLEIANLNDAGNFEEAWQLLEDVLAA